MFQMCPDISSIERVALSVHTSLSVSSHSSFSTCLLIIYSTANALIFSLMVLSATLSSSLVNVVGIRITLILGVRYFMYYRRMASDRD